MKRKRRSSKIVADKLKKPQGESKRKSCVRKHRKRRNCVESKKSRRLRELKSVKNGSEIKFLNEKLRKEREKSARDRIRLNSNGFARNEIEDRKNKQS